VKKSTESDSCLLTEKNSKGRSTTRNSSPTTQS